MSNPRGLLSRHIAPVTLLLISFAMITSSMPFAVAATQITGTAIRCSNLPYCSYTLTNGNGGTGTASTVAYVAGYVGQSPLYFSGGSVSYLLPGESKTTYASGVYSGEAVLDGYSSTAGTLYHVTGSFSTTDVNTGTVVTGSTDTVVGIKGHSGRGGGIYFTLVSGSITLDATGEYATATTVSCTPSSFSVGKSTTCTATVSGGSSPGGTVTFSQSGSSGSLSIPNPPTCNLSSRSCSLTMAGIAAGGVGLVASYAGDSKNLGSSGSFGINVMAIPTTTAVSCDPISIVAGNSTVCTATVTGLSPTGSVGWGSSSATGTFSLQICVLASGSCSVSYNDPTSAGITVSVYYYGDQVNLPSSGATVFANFTPAATAAALTTTSTGDRTAADQTKLTGVSTSITGYNSEDGVPVTIFSADLPSLPSGTPASQLGGTASYYLSVSGVYDGTAHECISNSLVDSTTQLDYFSAYYGYWSPATGITTVTGTSICGDIPVAAFTASISGAFLAIGYPLAVTNTTVQVSPVSVSSGNPTTVTVTVTGANPTGTVSFLSDGPGTFSSSACDLVAGTCSVMFTPATALWSPDTISASYGGDSANAASSGYATLNVLQHNTTTTIACSPSPGQVGVASLCTVTVTDTDSGVQFIPTGTVTFSDNNNGSFDNTTCTLDATGTCSVNYTPSQTGTATITVSYSGDNEEMASSGTVSL